MIKMKEDIKGLLLIHYIATGKAPPEKERLEIMAQSWQKELPESVNSERLMELLSTLRKRTSESPSISAVIKLHNEIDLKKERLELPLTVNKDADFMEHCIYHASKYPYTNHGREMKTFYLKSASMENISEWEIKKISQDYIRRKNNESILNKNAFN